MEGCPYHIDHENRIKNLETEQKAMKDQIKSPAVLVAFISLLGVCVTAVSSFAAVVLGPVIRAYLGV